MTSTWNPTDAPAFAGQIVARMQALPVSNTPNRRAVRRDTTKQLKNAPRDFVLALALTLIREHGCWGTAYELVAYHTPTFAALRLNEVEALGQGIHSWDTVDAFARTVSGPAWLKGRITDADIRQWAQSPDLWWRRAALVSTVALNMRSHGGYGDADRTLAVCTMLVDDHEDMVVKAMSWALRSLVAHNPDAVRAFVSEHVDRLAARVKREVRHKLDTGLKSPRRRL